MHSCITCCGQSEDELFLAPSYLVVTLFFILHIDGIPGGLSSGIFTAISAVSAVAVLIIIVIILAVIIIHARRVNKSSSGDV